eukprot:scaffold664218_cov57-Prasinocladus_malaysianus.AAC.1
MRDERMQVSVPPRNIYELIMRTIKAAAPTRAPIEACSPGVPRGLTCTLAVRILLHFITQN